jgi:hypothetical protein
MSDNMQETIDATRSKNGTFAIFPIFIKETEIMAAAGEGSPSSVPGMRETE